MYGSCNYLSIFTFRYLSLCLSIYLSYKILPRSLSIHIFILLSIYLYMYSSIYLSICLSFYLSIYVLFVKRKDWFLSQVPLPLSPLSPPILPPTPSFFRFTFPFSHLLPKKILSTPHIWLISPPEKRKGYSDTGNRKTIEKLIYFSLINEYYMELEISSTSSLWIILYMY